MTTLKQVGERGLIRRLAKLLPSRDDVRVGIGDDVAVVHVEGTHTDLLLTSDAVIEGTHFLPRTPAAQIGHKAIGRALSDMAAMGGEPLWGLIDLVAPSKTPVKRVEDIYRGAARLAKKYGLAIIGGDTTQGAKLELHVFAAGQVQQRAAVLRSGARPGDAIYVTGELGGSLAGKHLRFDPRIEEGLWLRESGWAGAMIDVSDGLVTDLGHIIGSSGVGAELDGAAIPVSAAARRVGGGRTPLEHALFDGEDFELLFTVAADKETAFLSSWRDTFQLRCRRVGRITNKKGRITLTDGAGPGRPLADRGFEHFRRG